MAPLIPLLAAAFLSSPAAASEACLASWAPEPHEARWEVSRAEWPGFCEGEATPEAALAAARAAFLKRSREAPPAVPPSGSSLDGARTAASGAARRVAQALEAGDVSLLYGERGPAASDPPPPPAPGTYRAAAGGLLPATKAGAAGARAVPPQPAAPPAARRAADIKTLQERVSAVGASPAAGAKARELLGIMLEGADPVVARNLVAKGVRVFVIPRDKKLTDLPEFSDMKGRRTFDGRLWDGVRGTGSHQLAGGGWAVAVAEENLAAPIAKGYPRLYLFVHEFAHTVQLHGLPSVAPPGGGPSLLESFELYKAAMAKPGKSTLGPYADANAREYFAEATAAYFDLEFAGKEADDRRDLAKNRPEMAAFLRRVYGPARSLRRPAGGR